MSLSVWIMRSDHDIDINRICKIVDASIAAAKKITHLFTLPLCHPVSMSPLHSSGYSSSIIDLIMVSAGALDMV